MREMRCVGCVRCDARRGEETRGGGERERIHGRGLRPTVQEICAVGRPSREKWATLSSTQQQLFFCASCVFDCDLEGVCACRVDECTTAVYSRATPWLMGGACR
jgi:hypothetical protein